LDFLTASVNVCAVTTKIIFVIVTILYFGTYVKNQIPV
jgi:hypothetical protein